VSLLWNAPDDAAFDEQLPPNLLLKAGTHFTPLDVARRAAILLAHPSNARVLDVGSGAGKFCIEAARVVPSAQFVGVELRPHLVRVATRLAAAANVTNARFIHGDALDLDWSEYDAFYFYNPFAEQIIEKPFTLDNTLALDPLNFHLYVNAVSERLAAARWGTRVVTYHGFGGPLPAGYELTCTDRIGSDQLELWIKRERATPSGATASR
jgi:SAM-dependent methyltransferase